MKFDYNLMEQKRHKNHTRHHYYKVFHHQILIHECVDVSLHTCALVIVYSRVENWGINSAGWFCSLIAAYCNLNRIRYKLHPEIRRCEVVEPEVGKCFDWSRSCKPTAWRGNQPEKRVWIFIRSPRKENIHLAHRIENSLAGLSSTSNRVILDGWQIRPLLQVRCGGYF